MSGKQPTNKHEKKSELMRAKLRRATVKSLDTHGYADTTLSAILAIAGVSSGALTHHYKNKYELICDTADMLLNEAKRRSMSFRQPPPGASGSEAAGVDETDILREHFEMVWEDVVHTRGGRALIEILVAVRTDGALRAQLSSRLAAWDRDMNDGALTLFEAAAGDEDVRRLWGMCRIFFRGLILQTEFVNDPAELTAYVQRFAECVAGRLRLRRPPQS